MAINIICPGCRTRFNVSDKFAGQKGPCPKCKTVIQIPAKSEEVVVHEPQSFGPKTTTGKSVLKPIFRQEAKLSLVQIIGIVASIILVLIFALVLRDAKEGISRLWLGIGALVLAFPLVFAGYTFLRDDELEAYSGLSLAIRVSICAVVYAVLWAVYAWVPAYAFNLEQYQVFHLLFIVPPVMALGAAAAFVSLDLDFGTGLLHYGMYVIVTAALAMFVGAPLF